MDGEGLENYSTWVVLFANFVNLSVYASVVYLVYVVRPVFVLPLFIYLVYLEWRIYTEGCANCCYYGKVCAFGRGKIAEFLVKRGDPKKFIGKTVRFTDFLPSLLVNVISLAAGAWLLVQEFSWLVVGLMAWPFVVWFVANPVLYGQMACPKCKQARLGCPVCKFFMGRNRKKRASKVTE